MQSKSANRSLFIITCCTLLFWKVLVLLLSELAKPILPFVATFSPFVSEYAKRFPYLVGIWGNFDGMHYLGIARHGYEPLKQAFFPLYPILIWATRNTIHQPFLISGLVVSHLLFLATIPFLYQLIKKDLPNGGHLTNWLFFLIVWLAFPSSFFYGAIYNDATFFFLATVSIFFARKKSWLSASIFAGLACLARLNGLALGIYLVCEYLFSDASIEESWSLKEFIKQSRSKFKPKKVWESGILWVALVPLSFGGYLAYLQYKFGSWMSLFNSMKIWKQSSLTFPPVVVWRYMKILTINTPHQLNFWVAVLELLTVLFYCHILLTSIKKVRFSYWIFIFFSILIPWTTGTFQGMPRYALHLYPFFLATTVLLFNQPKWVKYVYFILCLLIMFFILTLFTRGYFVT